MGFFKKENKKQSRLRRTLIVTSALMLFMSLTPAMAQNQTFDRVVGIETAYASEATFSEYWKQDASGTWHVYDGNGSLVKNVWLCDDAVQSNGQEVWYLIDSSGNLITNGLVQDMTGNVYSLETNHNGYFGMLRYKSGNYDGVYLDLEASHQGSFAKIKNQDGINALEVKCGLRAVSIDNANCVYTSTFKAGSGTGAAGGQVQTGPGGTSSPGTQTNQGAGNTAENQEKNNEQNGVGSGNSAFSPPKGVSGVGKGSTGLMN